MFGGQGLQIHLPRGDSGADREDDGGCECDASGHSLILSLSKDEPPCSWFDTLTASDVQATSNSPHYFLIE
jgi:hypothetical protein